MPSKVHNFFCELPFWGELKTSALYWTRREHSGDAPTIDPKHMSSYDAEHGSAGSRRALWRMQGSPAHNEELEPKARAASTAQGTVATRKPLAHIYSSYTPPPNSSWLVPRLLLHWQFQCGPTELSLPHAKPPVGCCIYTAARRLSNFTDDGFEW